MSRNEDTLNSVYTVMGLCKVRPLKKGKQRVSGNRLKERQRWNEQRDVIFGIIFETTKTAEQTDKWRYTAPKYKIYRSLRFSARFFDSP